MDDKFIEELREISRNDKRRSEFLIKGMKETLQERKGKNFIERWIWRQKNKKRIARKFKS
ncbi:Cft2 family RNA processing exonuclease [Paenibacillus polymyxa]|nr:Cft2 family RNA processing exonuclease [Paenibacillus polymyxa]